MSDDAKLAIAVATANRMMNINTEINYFINRMVGDAEARGYQKAIEMLRKDYCITEPEIPDWLSDNNPYSEKVRGEKLKKWILATIDENTKPEREVNKGETK